LNSVVKNDALTAFNELVDTQDFAQAEGEWRSMLNRDSGCQPLSGGKIGAYLGAILEDKVRHERPRLSAIAVNLHGKPGDCFFAVASELGKLTSDDPAVQETL
jgi:hypothetical protein